MRTQRRFFLSFSLFSLVTVSTISNKYTVIDTLLLWQDAELYCQSHFGTNLASIHNEHDHNMSTNLCQTLDGIGCWLGLNDVIDDGLFSWSDSSVLDFGTNTRESPPWPSHGFFERNFDGINDCVLIRGSAFANTATVGRWTTLPCNDVTAYFLCNKPSQTCSDNSRSGLRTVHGNTTWIDSCQFKSDGDSLTVITDRTFDSKTEPLYIEYIFVINNISDSHRSDVGVLLDYYGDCYWFFYVGLSVSDTGLVSLFIANVSAGNEVLYEEEVVNIFSVELNQSYALRIEVTNSSSFDVFVDSTQYIHGWRFDGAGSGFEMSGLIGVQNTHSVITTRSLYISGEPQWLSVADSGIFASDECPGEVKRDPSVFEARPNDGSEDVESTAFTVQAGNLSDWISEPVEFVQDYIALTISFDYAWVQAQNNPTRLQDLNESNANNIFRNSAIQFIRFLNLQIANISCVSNDSHHINIHNGHRSVIINASFVPCDGISASTMVNISHAQQMSMRESFGNILANMSDEFVLTPVANSTTFQFRFFQIVDNNAVVALDVNTTLAHVVNAMLSDDNAVIATFDEYRTFLIILAITMSLCVLVCAVILLSKHLHRQPIKYARREVDAKSVSNSITSQQKSTDELSSMTKTTISTVTREGPRKSIRETVAHKRYSITPLPTEKPTFAEYSKLKHGKQLKHKRLHYRFHQKTPPPQPRMNEFYRGHNDDDSDDESCDDNREYRSFRRRFKGTRYSSVVNYETSQNLADIEGDTDSEYECTVKRVQNAEEIQPHYQIDDSSDCEDELEQLFLLHETHSDGH